MQYSVAFASEVDSWRWAKRAEELGFHSAWFYDTQMLNPDVFICMALAAHETSRIRLGTGVLVPSNRIEPGRIDFGVGTGFTARRTMGLGAMSLKKMRRYIEAVRQLLRGEMIELELEGQAHQVQFLDPGLQLINVDDEVPVWVSAFGPKAKQLTADLAAGWLNFGSMGALQALKEMQSIWTHSGRPLDDLSANLFFLGAVLSGDLETDNARLMAQGGPLTAVTFHNLADEVGGMGGKGIKPGPLRDLLDEYLQVHDQYVPATARYLSNHRGHLMYVRPEETHITPQLVQSTTMSGEHDELVTRLRGLRDAGYTQLTVQLVHNHEAALEDWAKVFQAL